MVIGANLRGIAGTSGALFLAGGDHGLEFGEMARVLCDSRIPGDGIWLRRPGRKRHRRRDACPEQTTSHGAVAHPHDRVTSQSAPAQSHRSFTVAAQTWSELEEPDSPGVEERGWFQARSLHVQARGLHHPLDVEAFLADALVVIEEREAGGVDGADERVGDEPATCCTSQHGHGDRLAGMTEDSEQKRQAEHEADDHADGINQNAEHQDAAQRSLAELDAALERAPRRKLLDDAGGNAQRKTEQTSMRHTPPATIKNGTSARTAMPAASRAAGFCAAVCCAAGEPESRPCGKDFSTTVKKITYSTASGVHARKLVIVMSHRYRPRRGRMLRAALLMVRGMTEVNPGHSAIVGGDGQSGNEQNASICTTTATAMAQDRCGAMCGYPIRVSPPRYSI